MLSKLRQRKDILIARLLLRFPVLFRRWAEKKEFITFNDSPWTPLAKPLKQSNVALVTTGGVHLKTQRPFNMDDKDGDAGFREIPLGSSSMDLDITHNYYDHRDADEDVNIVFPIERIKALEEMGDIGRANQRHFSFMGHIINKQLDLLLNQSVPELVQLLKADEVDVVILSPA